MPKARKPGKVTVGRIIARPVRPPGKRNPDRWYWRAEEHRDGKSYDVLTGRFTVEEITHELARIVSAGPAPATRPRGMETTRDLLEAWIWHLEHDERRLKPSTRQGYVTTAMALCDFVGDVPIGGITQEVAEELHQDMLDARLAPLTVRTRMNVLRSCHRWAARRKYAPALTFDMPAMHRAKPMEEHRHTPTRDEVRRVLAHLPTTGQTAWVHVLVAFIAGTGARVHEVMATEWRHLDLQQGVWTVPADSKTSTRRVLLGADLVQLLAWWGPGLPGAQVIPRALSSASSSAPTKVARACAKAGVRYWSLRELRRMVVDELYSNPAIDPGTAAAHLGHSATTALAHYRRVKGSDLSAAAAAIGSIEPMGATLVALDGGLDR